MRVKLSFTKQNSIQSLTAKAKPTVVAIDSTTVLRLYSFFVLILAPLGKSSSSEPPPSFERYINDLVKCARHNDSEHRKIGLEEFSDLCKTSLSQQIFFKELIIYPQDFVFTFTADDSALSTLVDNTHSVERAAIHIRGFRSSNLYVPASELRQMLLHHYKTEMKENMITLIGYLADIGAPAELIERVGDGANKFFISPFVGLNHGVGGLFSGVKESVEGLKNGVGGVAKSLGMVGEGLLGRFAGLCGDPNYLSERKVQRRLGKELATTAKIGASLSLGFRSSVNGIMSMIEKEVTPDANEVGLALAGLFMKPIVGVGDGLAVALLDLGADDGRKQFAQRRSRKVVMRVDAGFAILPHDQQTSMAQEVIEAGGTVEDTYVHHILCVNELMIFSEQCLWLLNRDNPESRAWCTAYHDMSHYRGMKRKKKRKTIGLEEKGEVLEVYIFAYSLQGLLPTIVEVEGAAQRDEIFAKLNCFSDSMGNAGKLGFGERCQIKGGNIFGSINFCSSGKEVAVDNVDEGGVSLFQCGVPNIMRCDRVGPDSAGVVENTRKILSEESSEVSLDRHLWTLVDNFREENYCFGLGIINVSDLQCIVLNSATLSVGKSLIMIGTDKQEVRTEEDSWVINPGESFLLIATGEDEAAGRERVVLEIISGTFQVHFSDTNDGTFRTEGNCAVLEKAMGNRRWSKAWLGVGIK
jgi:hypothetical protein